MKYAEAKQGRVFVIRLEDGEVLHEAVESFARQEGIRAAALIVIGGADEGSLLVVGPQEGRARPVVPMTRELCNVYEVTGVGTIFPDEAGNPVLHMHISCGRKGETTTGCVRTGVKVWEVMEIVLWELTDCDSTRRLDEKTGFKLLVP